MTSDFQPLRLGHHKEIRAMGGSAHSTDKTTVEKTTVTETETAAAFPSLDDKVTTTKVEETVAVTDETDTSS